MTLTIEELQRRAAALADMPRIVKVEAAMERWGLRSKAATIHVLRLLEKRGYVKHVPNKKGDKKGEWILVLKEQNDFRNEH